MINFSSKVSQFKTYFQTKKQKIQTAGVVEYIFPLVMLLVAMVAVFAGVLGYNLGERQGKKQAMVITDHRGEVVSVEGVQAVYLENEILKAEVATLIQERDISLNNLNLVRDEIQELKSSYDEVSALNEALAHGDPNDNLPAQVLDMGIRSIGGDAYEYRFEVLISSTTNKRLVPKVTLLNATSLVEIPVTPSEFNTKGLVKIHGKFAMPVGFMPNQLKLVLNIDGQNIVKLYNWQVD